MKKYLLLLLIVLLLLMVPMLVMQFTDEVHWELNDFIIAGVLLLLTGFGFLWIRSRFEHPSTRLQAYLVLSIIAVLIWLELAVGIFGTIFSGS